MSQTTVDVVLSAIDKITAPIAAIQRRIERLTAPLGRVSRAIGDLGNAAGIGRLTSAIGGVGRALGSVTQAAAQATMHLTAMAGVSLAGIGAGLYGVLRTGGEFERYEIMLTGLMGTPEKAKAAMDWAEKFAQTTNLGVDQAVQSYIRLKNVGIDPTLGALQALTDYNAKVGGSYYELEGVMLAVTQMWGKQKISAEEMNQLIERRVPAWQLLAKATGKTVQELMKLSEKGKLGGDYIRALVTQMGKESKGASEAIGKSWDGILDRIGDAWKGFNKSIADAGVFDQAKIALEDLLSLIQKLQNNGQLVAWAKSVSDAMTNYLVRPLKDFLFGTETIGDSMKDSIRTPGFLVELPKHVKTGTEAITRIVEGFRNFYAAIAPVIDLVGGPLNAVLLSLGAMTFGPLIAALVSLTAAFWTLGVAILATPVGWFLGAVAAIAGAAYLIYDNWDGLASYFQGVWASVTAAFDDGITNGVMAALREFMPVTHIARGMQALGEYLAGIDLATEGSRILGSLLQGFAEQFAAFDSWLAGLEAQFFALGVGIVTSIWDGLKSQWSALVEWVRSAFADLTSWMPDWAKSKLGLSASVTSTTEAVTNAASVAPAVSAPTFEVPTGATVSAPSVAVSMPTAPSFALPSAAPPEPGGSTSTSQISAGTVDASSVNVSNFQVPEPIIANQPQNVTISAPFSATMSGLGLTAPEVEALIARQGAAQAARIRADTLSALGD